MAENPPYLEFLLEQLAPLGEITAKGMFGGHCLYSKGVVFALVANSSLYLKVDDENRPAFEARSLPAFRPFADKPGVMSYHLAPAEMFEDQDALVQWAGGAIRAGNRSQRKKRPGKKR